MSQDKFGVLDRRVFMKTALVSGAALTAGLPARSLLAAGKSPYTIRLGIFLETKPTIIAKGDGWFDKLAGGKCAWSEVGTGAEINTAMAAKSLDIGLAIGSSPTAAGISQKLPYELIRMVDNIRPAEDMIVRKAANIKKPAAFQSQKGATPFGSASPFPPLRLLKGHNPY